FARWIGLASAVALIALASALWPVTVALGAITLAVLVLAWRKPPVALASAVLLVGFEGSTKILLGLEPTPLPFSDRAIGAAALDIALFGAIAGVIFRDRFTTLRLVWMTADRAERMTIAVLGAWLGLSALQVFQGGDLARGV